MGRAGTELPSRPEEHLLSADARASVGFDIMCEYRTWHSDHNAIVSQSQFFRVATEEGAVRRACRAWFGAKPLLAPVAT